MTHSETTLQRRASRVVNATILISFGIGLILLGDYLYSERAAVIAFWESLNYFVRLILFCAVVSLASGVFFLWVIAHFAVEVDPNDEELNRYFDNKGRPRHHV